MTLRSYASSYSNFGSKVQMNPNIFQPKELKNCAKIPNYRPIHFRVLSNSVNTLRKGSRTFSRRRQSVRVAAAEENYPASELEILSDFLFEQGLPVAQKVTPQIKEGFGVSLVANQQVRQGEPLLQIPEDLILTADRALQEIPFGDQLAAAELSEQCCLAAFLATTAEALERGESQKWEAYMRVLPTSTRNIIEWTDKEISTLFKGSPTQTLAQEINQQVDSACDLLMSVSPAGSFSLQRLRWAFSVLFSRLVRLPNRGDCLALVPFADFLNHSVDCGTFIDFDPQLKAVVLRPDRNYSPGEQVFVSYGEKSSAELLLTYGFLPVSSNPAESVTVELNLDPQDPLFQTKADVLHSFGMENSIQFPLRMVGYPTALIPCAAFLALKDVTPEQVAQAGSSAFSEPWPAGTPLDSSLGGREGEVAARGLLRGVLREMQDRYEGTLDEDKRLATGEGPAKPEDKKWKTKKKKGRPQVTTEPHKVTVAAAIRLKERQILARIANILYNEQRELKLGSEIGRSTTKRN